MIKNLFVEKYLHDLRITNIITQSEKLGCDDCTDITVWLDLIKDIPFTFENGETWVIYKVQFYNVAFTGKYSGTHYENHIKVFFKSNEKKRCTYFSASESKSGKRVVNLFQDAFNKEWIQKSENTPILDAIEKYLQENS